MKKIRLQNLKFLIIDRPIALITMWWELDVVYGDDPKFNIFRKLFVRDRCLPTMQNDIKKIGFKPNLQLCKTLLVNN